MEKAKSDKLLNIFKNNKEVIAVYILTDKMVSLWGQIDLDVLEKIKNIVKNFEEKMNINYLNFSIGNYVIICFKYGEDTIILCGTPNIKEPLIRTSIKSLQV